MARGKYIIVSGGEGSGKSTIVNRLSDLMPDLLITREPGATILGQEIRNLVLRSDLRLSAWTEYYLFMADRANHMETLVRPALESGRHVVSDRGFPETFAYQLFTRLEFEDPSGYVSELQARNWPWPDLWILLDLDPAIGLKRRRLAGEENVFDQRDLDYHQRVRDGFHRFAKHAAFPVAVVDAGQDLEYVFTDVTERIKQLIGDHAAVS